MTAYARLFLSTLAVMLTAFGAFNFVVDPYALHGWAIPGVNERRTRDFEDGRRIQVGHHVGRAAQHSVVLGSSRVVDGFPRVIEDWPGGLYNAGMRGTNAFELAHAAALAGEDPELRCLVIGLDMWEFAGGEKFKPAFPVSRLSDGSDLFSALRVAMSPNTFVRAVQTVTDNSTGAPEQTPFPEAYPAGLQYEWFVNTPRGHRGAAALRVDPARMDLLFDVLGDLADSGVQVIGFLHPVHAYNEDAIFTVDRGAEYYQFREEVAARFAALTGEPVAACAPGGQGVLWDFAGYQSVGTTPLPGAEDTVPHPTHHEPAHYRPRIGVQMAARMVAGVEDGAFGVRLTPQTVQSSAAAIAERRARYLQTEDGMLLESLKQRYADSPAPAPESWPLTLADERQVERLSRRIASRDARLAAHE